MLRPTLTFGGVCGAAPRRARGLGAGCERRGGGGGGAWPGGGRGRGGRGGGGGWGVGGGGSGGVAQGRAGDRPLAPRRRSAPCRNRARVDGTVNPIPRRAWFNSTSVHAGLRRHDGSRIRIGLVGAGALVQIGIDVEDAAVESLARIRIHVIAAGAPTRMPVSSVS